MVYTGLENLTTAELISMADAVDTPLVAELTERLVDVWCSLGKPAQVSGEIEEIIAERDKLQAQVTAFEDSKIVEVLQELGEEKAKLKNAEARIATRDKNIEKQTEEILNLKIQLKQAASRSNDTPATAW